MTEFKEYSDREQKYIRENAGELSWSEIAYNLNKLYPTDNEGKRTRSGVVAWHTQDKNPLIRRQVSIPKDLYDQVKDIDLSEFICKGIKKIISSKSKNQTENSKKSKLDNECNPGAINPI